MYVRPQIFPVSIMATIPHSGGSVLLLLLMMMMSLPGFQLSTEPLGTKEHSAALPAPPQTLPSGGEKNHHDDRKPLPPPSASAEPHPSKHTPSASTVTPAPRSKTTTTEIIRLLRLPSLEFTAAGSPEAPSEATPETSTRSLTPAVAMLLLIVIVVFVGLLHFKVCAELRRCWNGDVYGAGTMKTVRSNVLEKWKKLVLGRLSARKSEVGDARAPPAGQPLILASTMPGGLSQVAVDCTKPSHV